jgi:hypothetical protein
MAATGGWNRKGLSGLYTSRTFSHPAKRSGGYYTNVMKKFSELNITQPEQSFTGEKIKLYNLLNREIIINDYRIVDSKFKNSNTQRLDIDLQLDNLTRLTWTGSKRLIDTITQIEKTDLPFSTTIVKEGESYKFT